MTTRKPPPHAWKKGESGNPRGRRPGSGEVAKLRSAIAEHVPTIIERLVAAALEGDTGAARLLLERVCPPLKATEEPAPLALPDGTLTEQGRAVLGAVAAGTLARVVEVDELERRLTALEATHAKP